MNKIVRLLFILPLIMWADELSAQHQVAVKSNVLYWGTLTPNLSLEAQFGKKTTGDMLFAYNPWTYSDDRKMRFILLQPEFRYWFCEAMEGHFIGAHVHGGQFFGGFRTKRYDGYLAGAGISYGYDWILSTHWNLEATFGFGFARLWYKEGPRVPCGTCTEDRISDYIGPTRLGISLVYIF